MATEHSPQSIDSSQPKKFDEIDAHLLEQTVERLVRYGQQVGVTPQEMISLLDSGMSIRDLLAFPRLKVVRNRLDQNCDPIPDDPFGDRCSGRDAQFVWH